MGPLPSRSESLTVLPPGAASAKSGAFCPTSSADTALASPRVRTIAAAAARIVRRIIGTPPPERRGTAWSTRREPILARGSGTPVPGHPVGLIVAALHRLRREVARDPHPVGVVVARHPGARRRLLGHPLIRPVAGYPSPVTRRRVAATAVAIPEIRIPRVRIDGTIEGRPRMGRKRVAGQRHLGRRRVRHVGALLILALPGLALPGLTLPGSGPHHDPGAAGLRRPQGEPEQAQPCDHTGDSEHSPVLHRVLLPSQPPRGARAVAAQPGISAGAFLMSTTCFTSPA